MSPSTTPRKRNPRGEGRRLRDEIVDAALRLVDAGGHEAVTLRAVAREARISAPSIYDHFADVDAVLTAAVGRCFAELTAAILEAREPVADPVQRLEAGCGAYLRYAERCPNRYALVFRRARPDSLGDEASSAKAAFETVVDGIAACVASGRSASRDPFADGVALWSGLHGYAGLRTTQLHFPWPEDQDTPRRIVHGLARITDPA